MSKAIEAVRAERTTQVTKGWDAEHDDDHGPEYLRRLASAYVDSAQGDSVYQRQQRRSQMVKAAALLIAAIEVIDRHEPDQTWPKPEPACGSLPPKESNDE